MFVVLKTSMTWYGSYDPAIVHPLQPGSNSLPKVGGCKQNGSIASHILTKLAGVIDFIAIEIFAID
jgi:hypothetical protein